jgi:hypothetical protein
MRRRLQSLPLQSRRTSQGRIRQTSNRSRRRWPYALGFSPSHLLGRSLSSAPTVIAPPCCVLLCNGNMVFVFAAREPLRRARHTSQTAEQPEHCNRLILLNTPYEACLITGTRNGRVPKEDMVSWATKRLWQRGACNITSFLST